MQLDYQDYIIPGNSRNGYILFAIQKAQQTPLLFGFTNDIKR